MRLALASAKRIARAKQSNLASQNQPWKHSSGPKSQYGKWVASHNARKGKSHQSASFVSPSVEGDKVEQAKPEPSPDENSRPLAVGDYVTYIGTFRHSLEACGGRVMQVRGFSNGAVACRVEKERVIWLYPEDLQRVAQSPVLASKTC